MKHPVVIVHYHLRAGGVTSVIREAAGLIAASGRDGLVVSSSESREMGGLPASSLHALAYGETVPASEMASQLEALVRSHFGHDEVIFHFHNHSLGKNPAVATLPAHLAERGHRLVLQLHDFAENQRPDNYEIIRNLKGVYPLAPRIHYASLNSRDQAILLGAGVPEGQAHLLPNSCSLPALPASPEKLVLYPVKAMPRKNLGEFCLLAAFAPSGFHFALGLPPDSPGSYPGYGAWPELARDCDLPIIFGVTGEHEAPGGGKTFYDWQRACSHCVTTSVEEGFGMVFLEPHFIQRPLLGRALPHCLNDLEAAGLEFPGLYDFISIPSEWLEGHADAGVRVDFASLSPTEQCQLIRDPGDPADILVHRGSGSERLDHWLQRQLADRTCPHPSLAAMDHFSAEAAVRRLDGIYAELDSAPEGPTGHLNQSRIYEAFEA